MSRFGAFLTGVGFRTSTPSFEPGEEIEVMVTGRENGTHVARVGDTKLRITDTPAGAVDTRIRARVESFDEDTHTGEATFLETVGQSAF